MDQGNPSQEWRGTTQTAMNCDTFWLQSFGTRFLANTKIYMFLCCFCFVLIFIWEQFPRTSSRGLIFGGAIWQRVFVLWVWGANIFGGAYTWRASFWNFMVYCCSITEEPLLLSVYLTIVVNKVEIEKHIAISINSPDYYYNKWISL